MRIIAEKDALRFLADAPVSFVEEYPLASSGRALSRFTPDASGRAPRFIDGRDRLFSAFDMGDGVRRYVTDALCDNDYPYPQPPTIKALGGSDGDIRALGLRQTLININLPAIMTCRETALPYVHNGRTYFFLPEAVSRIDDFMRHAHAMGLLVTMILLNSPRLFGSTGEKALLEKVIHPCYEWDASDAFISAFDTRRESGMGYYGAFVEFLAERYSRADARYGRALGMIVSNEVDSQCVWGNAGEMPVEEYAAEYALALRMAWLAGRKHYAHFRVYMSLDQFWHGCRYRPTESLHTYCGRDMVEEVHRCAENGGDFDWNIAYHPYPEDLRWPDFWHDRAPDFSFSTPKITFKNMEVLPAYLAQTHLLYRGLPRRILFSEQGFNSQSGALARLTEEWAAAGYCLAYMKARALDTVDLFTHHAYVDNPREFGLNLGIRRYDPAAADHLGEKKPIYDAVRDMDTENEPARVAWTRRVVGETLFDYLLAPPLTLGDRDATKDAEFG